MRVSSYGLMAMVTRSSLNRAFSDLNKTTKSLLSDVDVTKARANTATGNLGSLVDSDQSAVTSAITTANSSISMIAVADSALDTLVTKLSSMRDLVEEVLTVDHTAEEITAYDVQYQVLAGEVDDLLDDTVYGDRTLLSGRDPLVRLTLNSGEITSLELDALPAGAMELISVAISEITMIKVDMEGRTDSLTSSITELETHADELSGFENRLTTAAQAMAVLAAVTRQLVQEVVVGASVQANASPFASLQLFSA